MANSPTMCQLYVDETLAPLRQKYPRLRCIHYMDDILLTAKSKHMLEKAYVDLIEMLKHRGLFITPEKVQQDQVVDYLGAKICKNCVTPQKLELRKDNLKTLNDFQKLLGDTNWVRSYLKLPNYELRPLYAMLQGDPTLDSPRQLTKEARETLHKVEERLQNACLQRIQEDKSITLCILPTFSQPTGLLWQEGPLFRIHPKISPAKSIEYYPTAVAGVALSGIQQCLQYFGSAPSTIIVPYTSHQVQTLCATIDDWAILQCSFTGQIDNHFPKHPLLGFFKEHPIIFPKVTTSQPIVSAPNVFTDGSKTGCGVYMVEAQRPVQHQFQPGVPQMVELKIVIKVFEACPFPFNLISDSAYVINALKVLEVAGPIKSSSPVGPLFQQLQRLIWQRKSCFYPLHIRAHTGLPGPLSKGNDIVDQWTRQEWVFISSVLDRAKIFHKTFHVNAKALQQKFQISRADARQVILDCPRCVIYQHPPSIGVNPRGLLPLKVWQMDVTHISEFGHQKYVHVSVDTCSGVIHAMPLAGEKARNVIAHCLEAWAAWGKPYQLKTDNGPVYTGQQFASFCHQMEVQLIHGLPYNPQGQGIVERAHRTIKECLQKQKGGIGHGRTPKERLSLALFTINFLNLDAQGQSTADRHNEPHGPAKGMVKWKDVLTGLWGGPDPMLTWARGSVCVFPQDQQDPVWVPEHLTRKAQCEEAREAGGDDPPAHPCNGATGKTSTKMGDPVHVPETDARTT
ncbi:PREDICTED: endogenous retrovirus group K member 8 Pol protein-like [Dipodomys ordii]|uniref:Endogenous retrovirus group K member 8 Pol protein-like n=1 Tax=Dipodomys ordii TaxID=10020 RepID=A0A1S3F7N1_DIPOR|nr:PREDICTED: endogenous retrovirus group K member 8 Pol protein-like [Dipodomys ordii]